MKKRKRIGSLVVMLLITMLISACQQQPAEEIEAPEEAVIEDYNPEDSLPLRLAITRPTKLNPLFNANDTLYQVYHLIYEGLIGFDEHMNLQPLLAENWELDESGSRVTFNLRQNVTWHDGELFTPEDVVFSFQVLRNHLNTLEYPNLYTTNLQQVSDVRKTGDNSVTFTFTRPYSNALETLVFPILPQHLFSGPNAPLLSSDDFPIVGTGRYQLEKYDASREMALRYYSSYWGRKPYIDEINIQIVPDREAQISMFENGEIDLVEPAAVDWLKYTDNDQVMGISFPSSHYEFIGFNFRNETWRQKELRQAIDMAIPKQEIINTIYFGHGTEATVPVHPVSWLYQTPEETEEEPGVAEAQELIQRLQLPEDTTFQLLTNAENPMRVKTAEAIASTLEEIGLMVTVEPLGWDEMQERLASGDFDMVLTGWHFSLIPDLSFAFHSTQESMGNFIGYANEEMDELLESAFFAPTRENKATAWHRLQDHLQQELPYVSLFFKDKAVLYRTTLRGELAPTQYNVFNGIETAYLIRPREAVTIQEGQ